MLSSDELSLSEFKTLERALTKIMGQIDRVRQRMYRYRSWVENGHVGRNPYREVVGIQEIIDVDDQLENWYLLTAPLLTRAGVHGIPSDEIEHVRAERPTATQAAGNTRIPTQGALNNGE